MSRSWSKGSTRAWRRTRAAVLLRDGYTCRLALPGCTGRAQHAHHTLGRAVSGDDMRYIVASCQACNLHTGQPALSPKPRGGTQW